MKALFLIGPFHGHINASFGIADLLRDNHWSVIYALNGKFKNKIEHNGFNFSPLTTEVTGRAQNIEDIYGIINKKRKLKNRFHKLNQAHWLITNKELNTLFNDNNFNLVVVDTSTLFYGLAAICKGYKILVLNPLISENYDSKKPPYFSSHIPNGNLLDSLFIKIIWETWFLRRKVVNYICHKLISPTDFFYFPNVLRNFKLNKEILKEKRTWVPGIAGVPELLFYTKEFDFPGNNDTDEWYIGPAVYKARKEHSKFNWDGVDTNKCIVYCCMGTLAANYKYVSTIFNRVIKAFAGNMDYELIVSTGGSKLNYENGGNMTNVHIYDNVPQLEILGKTSLMINHGGGNSIRECILAGVPSLTIPLSRDADQYGFAARIHYHKMGMLVNKSSSTRIIRKKSLAILNDPIYKEQVLKIRESFVQCQDNSNKLFDEILSYIHGGKAV